MANYEIMLVVSGSLDEKAAKTIASEIATSIKECKPKVEEYGSKQLAYKIKKDTTGYYFQYNFECETPANINEFRRLATLNKNVLRHIIINLEKDYGYKATINPKKIAANAKSAEIHSKRKIEIEKMRAQRDAERAIRNESGDYSKTYGEGERKPYEKKSYKPQAENLKQSKPTDEKKPVDKKPAIKKEVTEKKTTTAKPKTTKK